MSMNSLLSPPSSLTFFTIPNPTQPNPLSAEAAAKVQLSIPFGKEKFEKNFQRFLLRCHSVEWESKGTAEKRKNKLGKQKKKTNIGLFT